MSERTENNQRRGHTQRAATDINESSPPVKEETQPSEPAEGVLQSLLQIMQTQNAMLQQLGTQVQHVTMAVESLQTRVQVVKTNEKLPASVQSSMPQQDQNLYTQSPQPTSTEYARGYEDIRQQRSKGKNTKPRNKDRRYSTLDDFFAERERPCKHLSFGSRK